MSTHEGKCMTKLRTLVSEVIEEQLQVVWRNTTHVGARCPFHDDRKGSFSIKLGNGLWKCHSEECARTGNYYTLRKHLDSLPTRFGMQTFPVTVRQQSPEERAAYEARKADRPQVRRGTRRTRKVAS